VTATNEFERMWKVAVVTRFEAMSVYLLGETEERLDSLSQESKYRK
jgi:hypothetical protein